MEKLSKTFARIRTREIMFQNDGILQLKSDKTKS